MHITEYNRLREKKKRWEREGRVGGGRGRKRGRDGKEGNRRRKEKKKTIFQ